jgi:hypothetical protein
VEVEVYAPETGEEELGIVPIIMVKASRAAVMTVKPREKRVRWVAMDLFREAKECGRDVKESPPIIALRDSFVILATLVTLSPHCAIIVPYNF